MAVEALASFIYSAVEHSWQFSTVLVKYILIAHVAELFYRGEANLRNLEEIILEYSYLVVASVVLLGFIGAIFNIAFEPYFQTVSEIVAVIYFGFLFWKF